MALVSVDGSAETPWDMPDRDDPFHVLGVDPSVDEADLRRAYLRLVRVHPPERDPQGFRRIRDAYEAALTRVVERTLDDDDEANKGADVISLGRHPRIVRSPRLPDTPSPRIRTQVAQLRTALERRDLVAAVDQVVGTAWQMDVRSSPLMLEATVRLGCGTIWVAPELHERLRAALHDVLDEHGSWLCAGVLPMMRALTRHYLGLRAFRAAEPWILGLLEYGVASGPSERRATASVVLDLLEHEPRKLLRALERVQSISHELVELLGHLARELPGELGFDLSPEASVADVEPELVATFPWGRGATLAPAVFGTALMLRRRGMPLLAFGLSAALFRTDAYAAAYRAIVRPRLLRMCVEHHIRPSDVATWASGSDPWSRQFPYSLPLRADAVIGAAFDLARFAMLVAPQ